MAGFFSRWFSTAQWDLEAVPTPWGDRPSILGHIEAHIHPGRPGLIPGGETLPDEDPVEEGDVRWVAGGLDGAFGHHGGGGRPKKEARRVFGLLKRALRSGTAHNIHALYEALQRTSAINFVDPFSELVRKNTRALDAGRANALALWVASRAADQEPVKVAIALLGLLQGEDHIPLLLTLGRHEEFTLYAAVAICNTLEDSHRTLWELAKSVDGWGRIHIVERLAETTDAEIRGWLLLEGYKNSVMYEYLAHTCAVAGELHQALAQDQVDDDVFAAAGDLLEALVCGGPAEDIDDYPHSAAAMRDYLRHAETKATEVERLRVLQSLEQFLDDDEGGWEARQGHGWSDELRKDLLQQARDFINRPGWGEIVRRQMGSEDELAFIRAASAAEGLGLDPWSAYFARLKQGGDYWYQVMQTRDAGRAAQVVALAQEILPLSEIGSGPGQELGLGPQWAHHGHLDFVLQDLRRFPNLGWPLIQAGLRSPVVRNRNMAIRALAAWDRDRWPEGATALVKKCLGEEPDDEVCKRLEDLIKTPEEEPNPSNQ